MANVISENVRTTLGGKASTLHELQSAGFLVPDFVVSPTHLPKAVEALGLPLAVRSSATLEDGCELSFAGQFESFLNLNSLQAVETAVDLCRASVNQPLALNYCRANGVDVSALRMEVLVQRMIMPEIAGVAFTVNPATGAEEVVVEACEGTSEELLAGRQSALPADDPRVIRYFPEIEKTCREIQRHFGAPQDIEFAIENGTLFILQSRPITKIAFHPNVGEWTNADFRDGGVSSGVCSPLMWSLYQFIWDRALNGFLKEIRLSRQDFPASNFFFGRPYWNLGGVKQCVAKLPGFVEREFDLDLSVEPQYEGDGICTPVTLLGVLRVLPTLLAVRNFFRSQSAFDRQFLDEKFSQLCQGYQQVSNKTERFRELIEHAYFTTETNYFRTIFAASLAKLDFMTAFPDANYPSLVAALPKMRHMAPIDSMRDLIVGNEQERSRFLRQFRHHSCRGQDISQPRWDEDPELIREMIETLPNSVNADPTSAYQRAREQALLKLPVRKRKKFNRKLDRLRDFVWLREEMRDLSSQMYYLIRRHVLEIARQKGIGDDIFFMTFQEILDDDRAHIDRRREVFESYRNFQAPNEIGSRFTYHPRLHQGALRGIGASPGNAKGVARIARTVQEALQIERNAILICPFTEPGWTPVLDRAIGVVTETGGLLSHAAVICREYGIPAVLGVTGATKRIRDGSVVMLDGDNGFVEVLG